MGRFLKRLHGIADPRCDFLAQGAIYPDRVESAATSDLASRIKSHHNVGALPDEIKLRLIELIRDLYKDEVRAVAKKPDLPENVFKRHTFQGLGLVARVIGEATLDKLRICRDAGAVVE